MIPAPVAVAERSEAEVLAVLQERVRALRADFRRWAKTCYRIRTKAGGRVVPLVLNAAQQMVEAAEQEQLQQEGQVRLYVLKGRQGGVTTHQQAKNLNQIWRERGFDCMTLAHSDGDTSKIFEMTRRAIDHFPPALLPRLGGKETSEISFPGRDSRFWTGTAGAKRTGRGLTLKRVHGSEFAFWKDPVDTLGTISPTLEGVPGNAIVLETTASDFDSAAHRFWNDAVKGENGYRAVFIPWWLCDIENYRAPLAAPDELGTLSDEEKSLIARAGLSLEQIKWRRRKIRELHRAKFIQEYAEDDQTCWLAAGELFYDADLLKLLMGRAPEPVQVGDDGVRVYRGLPPGERAILGADTAEGGAGEDLDRSTFVARSFPSRRLLAEFSDRKIEPKAFAALLSTWGKKLDGAYLVVEKNAHGITVLRELRDTLSYPLDLIFHRTPLGKTRDKKTDEIGWQTLEGTQPLLLDAGRDLLNAARDGQGDPPSKAGLTDAFNIKRDKNGRYKLNGRDVWVAEALAEVGRNSIPPKSSGGAVSLRF